MTSGADTLTDLIGLLRLERLEVNLFRGESRDIGSRQVFGGQVLGQALSAASQTVEDRSAHSLHAYFLRRGDIEAPIVYEVDRQRDGGSFSNRRVVAIQHGRPILNLAVSFQKTEEGVDHQSSMPNVPPPDEVPDVSAQTVVKRRGLTEKVRRLLDAQRPFDLRQVPGTDAKSGVKHIWMRTVSALPDSERLHRAMLAYVSDYGLLTAALMPHGIEPFNERLIIASLDHAMWFHRPFRMDEWLLYCIESPNAHGARGLALGRIYRQDGTLVASVGQEGLIRLIDQQS